jgi:hypothetical protein
MFKIFNKKRKQIVYNDKNGKYIKYAIGEIGLIVIGILIALQINNGNVYRKEKLKEIQLLKGIRSDIINDTLDFNEIINGYQDHIYKNNQLLNHIIYQKEIDSSFVYLLNEITGTDSYFLYNQAHFKEAQQRGLAIISNQKLRKSISRLYEYDYAFYEIAENESDQFNIYRMMNKHLVNYLEYDSTGLTMSMVLYNKLLSNKNLSFQIKRAIGLKKQLLKHCQLTLKNALDLEKLITNELKHLN